jgi:exosortase D (VPLPA-CTERM-specific)
MIPLPNFLYNNLSQQLQLISSELGVWVIRQFGVSVFLEGNVIDLGAYKLQVVEACSGLRYLFPLMSFGFLIAYVYRGPTWQRWLIFLSTLPITVLMNSFRIGVIGVTVKHWGTAAADGFLHDFEGWVVFMACVALLCIEVWILNKINRTGKSMWDAMDLSTPSLADVKASLPAAFTRLNPYLIATTVLVLAAIPVSLAVKERTEIEPPRQQFVQFPLVHKGWMGQEGSIEDEILTSLRLTDYIKADYRRGSQEMPVNFYIAYYASQRKGSSIHSPRSCIPGDGWVIASHTQVVVPQLKTGGLSLNRLVIQKGKSRQLVYYWFDQRGRAITNEYLAKWFLFQDSLTQQRTDGALVRLVTPVLENTNIDEADERLQDFLRDFYPLLPEYIPQ